MINQLKTTSQFEVTTTAQVNPPQGDLPIRSAVEVNDRDVFAKAARKGDLSEKEFMNQATGCRRQDRRGTMAVMARMAVMAGLSSFLAFAVLACNTDNTKRVDEPKIDTVSFERAYVQTLDHQSAEGIKLIGFKKITFPPEEIESFDAVYTENKEAYPNYLFDASTGLLKVYFPVESALVEVGDEILEASTLGELDLEMAGVDPYRLSVIGRRQTDNIRGVEGNIVRDGVIYLAEKNVADHHFDDVLVFDFGVKVLLEHDHDQDHEHVAGGPATLAEKKSCINNHGGPNCSDAFGIHEGRCRYDKKVCMDYNGPLTNCKNGKRNAWRNFPRSDCALALGRGHCWNEVM